MPEKGQGELCEGHVWTLDGDFGNFYITKMLDMDRVVCACFSHSTVYFFIIIFSWNDILFSLWRNGAHTLPSKSHEQNSCQQVNCDSWMVCNLFDFIFDKGHTNPLCVCFFFSKKKIVNGVWVKVQHVVWNNFMIVWSVHGVSLFTKRGVSQGARPYYSFQIDD
jgi:hypothetical protein